MTFYRGFISGAFASVTCYALYNFAYISKEALKIDDNEFQIKEKIQFQELPYLEDVRILEKARATLKYGIPEYGPRIIHYNNHVLAYDITKKIPVWVAEHITRQNLNGEANRKKSKFKPDPDIPDRFTARNEDYFKSGWSRGHMAPAGNYKNSQKSMDETFFLTNIVPQDYKNNGGFWNRFEIYCRDLTKLFHDVRVFTGPLVLPEFNEDGRLYVKYPVIGQSQVTVPTHLFKVIVAEKSNSDQTLIGAFVVPNKPIGFDYDLQDFQVKLEDLEMKSGITFLPKLHDTSKCVDLCKAEKCRLMTHNEFELYVFGRRLQGARNIDHLQNTWNELEEKNLEPDQFLIDLYNRKKTQFEETDQKAELEKDLKVEL